MGNIIGRFKAEEDHADYIPTHYGPQYHRDDQPAAAPRLGPRPQHALGPHGAASAIASVTAWANDLLNFVSTSMAGGPNNGNLHRSSDVRANSTEDIDESSAEGLHDAESYAKANAFLIQVSNVWIGSAGTVKLRGVSFTVQCFSLHRMRHDYKHLSKVLQRLIAISGGDITKLPPDYKEFLALLEKETLVMKDEFLIVNNSALLPMKNRTEVFLMLYDRIVTCLHRTARAKKWRILSKLPYENDWLDTAIANTEINQWVVNVQKQYERNQHDQLRLNRNVRSHLHHYNNNDDIEEILYCEWPELLMDMVKMLHVEGELEATDIQNKFGC